MRKAGLVREAKKPAPAPGGQPGIHQPFWFYGCEAYYKKPVAQKSSIPAPVDTPEKEPEKTADEQVQDIILKAPNISGPALVNSIKARGLKIVDEKGTLEADSATTQTAVMRQSATVNFRARFMEADTYTDGVGPVKFKVALIQEGLGNLRDGFYYTRQALEGAIATFEGKKCFADHPSRSEEQDRPERSVRDIIGHFENVHIEEGDGGAVALVGDLVMPPDPPFAWARALVRQATEYNEKFPDQNFVGLSINANGDAAAVPVDEFLAQYKVPEGAKPKLIRAREDGMSQVRVVSAITDAISCDLVTEPGAKGRVIEIVEAEKGAHMKKKEALPAKEESKLKHSEDEAKQAMQVEDEVEDEVKKEADEDHADEEQDKKLILDMIKKHMGSEEEMESEQEAAAIEACEAYKEMGYSEDEAMKCAAHAMKLAKHMAAKREAAEAVKTDTSGSIHTEDEAVSVAKDGSIHTESERIIKAEAKIALLERELKKRELGDLLDKKLRESGLGRAETDKVRALIGVPKSVEQIEHTLKVFKEAFGLRSESKLKGLFVTGTEKEAAPAKREGKFSFGDCVSE